MHIDHYLIFCIKIHSKWIINVKAKTVKFLNGRNKYEIYIGESLCELEDFLDKIQKRIHHNRKG